MDAYLIKPFLKQLGAARKARSLSQTAVSQKLGFPQSYLSAIENGKHDIRLSTFVELARFLDLEVALIPRQLGPQVRQLMTESRVDVDAVDEDRAFVANGDEDDQD